MDLITRLEAQTVGNPVVRETVAGCLKSNGTGKAGAVDSETKWLTAAARRIENANGHGRPKFHLIYLVHYPLPNVIRQSMALRQTGHYRTTLVGYCIREEMRLERFFDVCIECNSYRMMAQLLQLIKADAVQAVNGPSIVPALATIYADMPVVVELYDSIIFYWSDVADNPDYQLEKFSLQRAAGILHKYPRPAHFYLQDYYNLCAPVLQFHAYVVDTFVHVKKNGNPITETPRVIYTGGLMPPRRAVELGHTNHLFFDLIHEMKAQGIQLTIYANQNAKNMRWHRQKAYFDLHDANSYFRLKCGLPIDKIAKIGSRYHYGLFYDNLPLHRFSPIHFKYMTATKFFSYLEMGLPILIYPECEFLYRLCMHYKVGVSYDAAGMKNLDRAVRRQDYDQLKRNVRSLRHLADIRNHILVLQKFYNHVLQGKKQDADFDRFFPLEPKWMF